MLHEVPHLTTALVGPLQFLEKKFLDNQCVIEGFFRRYWRDLTPPFYASVDLRNAGFKLAPVDTNLFPAGFNNLNPDFLPLCIQAAQNTLEKIYPGCQNILLIPESHTRNYFYLENMYTLQMILTKAGYHVRIGSLIKDLKEISEITLPSKNILKLEPLLREQDYIQVKNFKPCIVLLNNDLTDGVPDILQNIKQPILPPLALGWANRTKSAHFAFYEKIANELSALIDIDPWFIQPLFSRCSDINFLTQTGEDCLIKKIIHLRDAIQRKYDQYQIDQKPFITIKAESGTYGMGILMLEDPEELKHLNRKERTNMSIGKGGQKITKVIIQEGVPTYETIGPNNSVAEPVVYMMGQHVIGGFYRVHTNKGSKANLNSPGMHFEPLAFFDPCNNPNFSDNIDSSQNRFYAYGVIARLALIAAALEIKEVSK